MRGVIQIAVWGVVVVTILWLVGSHTARDFQNVTVWIFSGVGIVAFLAKYLRLDDDPSASVLKIALWIAIIGAIVWLGNSSDLVEFVEQAVLMMVGGSVGPSIARCGRCGR